MNEQDWLKAAIQLASKSVKKKGGPFGAIVMKDGVVVGEGMNQVTKKHDPTAHAEVVAIRNACKKLGTHKLDGCVIYASCEPCPMCLGAIYWARLERVYYAATRHEAADAGFDDAMIYQEIGKEPPQRTIPFHHIEIREKHEPFRNWQKQMGRIDY
ncbi:nucleoside deaminase [Pseudalkalibacillus hwajinpoensis]|uniref:Nucleoside deaminase n=1 Tax=Guptibacillus hwajinpoensis TaxID=208199 RepID=A0A4U1MNZ6_9BACL|nr:nucleoside deaminase [Pseudalkalibacillus hwajinpoensis]TKD72435.1 nucleoside deaminase [Pseudalkalibacillus hwajinpoensis]